MKPAPFNYVVAKSIEHAVALLSQHGAGAKLIAGGQSLVPMMNFRLARPEWLIDINRISDLAGIRFEGGALRISSQYRVEFIIFRELRWTARRRQSFIPPPMRWPH